MTKNSVTLLVFTDCPPEMEAKFNKWYDEVHIPLLFKFKGMKEVQRCRLLTEDKEHPKYLATYQFENESELEKFMKSPERAVAMADVDETWKKGKYEVKLRATYEILKTWQR